MDATGRVEGVGTGTMCHYSPTYLPTDRPSSVSSWGEGRLKQGQRGIYCRESMKAEAALSVHDGPETFSAYARRKKHGREAEEAREQLGGCSLVPSLIRLSIPRERRLLGSLHWYLCLLRHLAVIGCIGLGSSALANIPCD